MTTLYSSFDGRFQQHNVPCYKTRVTSNWFCGQDNEFTVLKWPPQSPDRNPVRSQFIFEAEKNICNGSNEGKKSEEAKPGLTTNKVLGHL